MFFQVYFPFNILVTFISLEFSNKLFKQSIYYITMVIHIYIVYEDTFQGIISLAM